MNELLSLFGFHHASLIMVSIVYTMICFIIFQNDNVGHTNVANVGLN